MKVDHQKLTERLATLAGVVYPLTALPQAIKVFSEHNASGLSLISWAGFAFVELLFLAYGVSHKLKPIIITGILWTILYGTILYGIIKYS